MTIIQNKIKYFLQPMSNRITFPKIVMNFNVFSEYSSTVNSCIDKFDVFLNVLLENTKNQRVNKDNINVAGKLIYQREEEKELCNSCSGNEILKNHDCKDARKMLDFYVSNQIVVSNDIISTMAEDFVKTGDKVSLLKLNTLCELINAEEYFKEGKYLFYLSKVAWTNNNTQECVSYLKEYYTQFPVKMNELKLFISSVIEVIVGRSSEAQLVIVTDFIKHFCLVHNDYHMLFTLWLCLFQSNFFSDQQSADQLLSENIQLETYLQLTAVPLSKRLLLQNKTSQLHSMLQLLLKYNMTEQYKMITRIMFDYYFLRGNEVNCAEIVKCSVNLSIPLRNDQYEKFICFCLLEKRNIEKAMVTKLMKYL